jgi:hypothetical protein
MVSIARKIELFEQCYQLAWGHISQNPIVSERPGVHQILHDAIRRELVEGATDPVSIAAAAIRKLEKFDRPDSSSEQSGFAPPGVIPQHPQGAGLSRLDRLRLRMFRP